MNDTILAERRQKRRIKVGEEVFVCLGTQERKLWRILDISSGGLAFRYIPGSEAMEGPSELEIITRDAGFSIEKVPFKPVSDRQMNQVAGLHFDLRRRSVQFGDLTQVQAAQLEQFLSVVSTDTQHLQAA